MDDVAVAHHIVAALEPLFAALAQHRVRPRVEQLLGSGHLGADETARDVGVDARRGVERGLALAKIPRAHLGIARGEERDQPEQSIGAARDPVQAGLLETEVVQERRPVGGVELGDVVLDARRDGDRLTACD